MNKTNALLTILIKILKLVYT